jgi:IS30 family transposase
MIANRISLELRPTEGIHGQGDTFLSPKKSGSKHAGALICEPNSQLLVGEKICNLKSKSMTRAIVKINKRIKLDDLTLDNGIENRDHKNFKIPSYFADPYSPWQKPDVENNIGLLRKWFLPKGTNLSKISNDELQKYLHILNHKYRKSLGYKNAYEVAFENGIIKKIPETYQEAMCNYY